MAATLLPPPQHTLGLPHMYVLRFLRVSTQCNSANSQCKNLCHDAQVYLSTFARVSECVYVCVYVSVCVLRKSLQRHAIFGCHTPPTSMASPISYIPGYPQVPQQAPMVMQAALQLECMQAHTLTFSILHSAFSILHSTLV